MMSPPISSGEGVSGIDAAIAQNRPQVLSKRSVTVDTWIAVARLAIVEEGESGLKVDRLAVRLGVSRGAFYHRFEDRDHLLRLLLAHWEDACRFLPTEGPGRSASQAADWFDRMVEHLLDGDGFDPRFDLAVRGWARADQRAAWAVEREDRRRLQTLVTFFEALGYPETEARIRARVLYYHQIGYYSIDPRQSTAERRRDARVYAEILCGPGVLAAARRAGNDLGGVDIFRVINRRL